MGLLQKSLMLSEKKALTFLEFINKYKIQKCLLLKKHNNDFLVSNCIGLDLDTIFSSISTNDFWLGSIKENNKLYFFDEENLLRPFLQLFSANDKEQIKLLYIYKTEDTILLICEQSNSNIDLLNELNNEVIKIKEDTDFDEVPHFDKENKEFIQLFKLTFDNKINSYIQEKLINKDYLDLLQKAVENRIINQLKQNLNSKDFIVNCNNFVFKFTMTTITKIPQVLLKQHLQSTLNKVLTETSYNFVLEDCGIADNYEELSNFLKAN